MSIDKEAFKAEVRRRGRERIAARKRRRNRLITGCATLTVCMALFFSVTPSLNFEEKADSANDAQPETLNMQANASAPEETLMENVPDILPNEPTKDDESLFGALSSVEVTSSGEDGFSRTYTDSNSLFDIWSLFNSIETNPSEENGKTDGQEKPRTGYLITVTYRFGETDEYLWNESTWYDVQADRTIILTEENIQALTALLLECEAD